MRAFMVGPLIAIALLGACGDDEDTGRGSDDGQDAGEPAAAELEDVVALDGTEIDVVALDNSFNEQNIRITPGASVVWENKGRQDHDVVPVDGADWGVAPDEFAPGDVYEHTFEEPGTYRYYCSLHGNEDAGMTGAIVVE